MPDLPNLVVMVGYPRAGKSTWVREWYIPNGYSAVSRDMIRHVLRSKHDSEALSHFTDAIVYAAADSLLAMGNKVVVDSTHSTRRHRDHWLRRGALFHYISTPIETCLERARGQSNACDIVPVIQRMALDFDPLEEYEPQWSPRAEEIHAIPVPAQ